MQPSADPTEKQKEIAMAGGKVTIPRLEAAAKRIDDLQSSSWLKKMSERDREFVNDYIVPARDAINDVLELMRDHCDLEMLLMKRDE